MTPKTRDRIISYLFLGVVIIRMNFSEMTVWDIVGMVILYNILYFAVILLPIGLSFIISFCKVTFVKRKIPKPGSKWYNLFTKDTYIITSMDSDGIYGYFEGTKKEFIVSLREWTYLRYDLLYQGMQIEGEEK